MRSTRAPPPQACRCSLTSGPASETGEVRKSARRPPPGPASETGEVQVVRPASHQEPHAAWPSQRDRRSSGGLPAPQQRGREAPAAPARRVKHKTTTVQPKRSPPPLHPRPPPTYQRSVSCASPSSSSSPPGRQAIAILAPRRAISSPIDAAVLRRSAVASLPPRRLAACLAMLPRTV